MAYKQLITGIIKIAKENLLSAWHFDEDSQRTRHIWQ